MAKCFIDTSVALCWQSQLNVLESEVQQVKDSHMQHKKRIAEMMSSLMKDLSEVGTVIGNNTVDIKVQTTTSVLFVAVRKTPVDAVKYCNIPDIYTL